MKLYRTRRGNWAGTQDDARAAALEDCGDRKAFELVIVPTDKQGLIAWLNDRAPTQAQEVAALVEASRSEPAPAAAEPMTEDVFEALPLSMQLHLAALAVENARDKLPG